MRILLSKRLEITSADEKLQKREHVYTVGEDVNWAVLWKTVWRFFKRLRIELPYDPAYDPVGTGGPRGATPRSRSSGVVVRRYPLSKVRSSSCALLEQP